ncbi:MAG TPA: ABC transporter substrate-binding protein [Burkholderiaceae bacterium]|nr:ABC transporter substrate-binding protein [Burkholderiaceae bacterium]
MNRRNWTSRFAAICVGLVLTTAPWVAAHASVEGPDALIKRLSTEVLDTVKADAAMQAGDMPKVMALVDGKIMPNVNFERMTASAVGRFWRQASPDQQKQLQAEFKTLLVRTYSGALSQVKDQTLSFRPLRAAPTDTEVVVRTEVRGRGDPVQLDYRLEKTDAGWKIYDLNVMGVWLVETYRTQFAQEIAANGIDGLIASLTKRNRANTGKAG